MFYQWHQRTLFSISLVLLLVAVPANAVEVFKVSSIGGGHQIWFEAEDYDERIPDTDQYFLVVDKDDAFGQAVTRAGGAGGRIAWTFDISAAGAKKGTWYFWARVINPSNQSDYMLVEGDSDDKKIPDALPFPGGDAVPPFDNADDRIFEQDTGPPWAWAIAGHPEGHIKELQDGENTMYIFHRQGNNTRFMDVFVWTDDSTYFPRDSDYTDAKEMKAGQKAVEPTGKLTTVWGKIKSVR